jgi:AraC-like DNA-binding protein
MPSLLLPLTAATAFLLGLFVAALLPARRRGGVGPLLLALSVLTALVGLGLLARAGLALPGTAGDVAVMGLFASLPLLAVRVAARSAHPVAPTPWLDRAAWAVPAMVLLGAAAVGASGWLGRGAWQGFTVALHLLALGSAAWIARAWRAGRLSTATTRVLAAFGVHWLWSAGSSLTAAFAHRPALGAFFEAGSLLSLLGFGAVATVHGLRRLPALVPPLAPYTLGGLPEGSRHQLAGRLREVLDTERPYLDPDLRAEALAARIGASTRELSEVLRLEFGTGFFAFVNALRVEEARRQLADPANDDRTVLDVLYASGFNSKSAFHRAFRETVGETPSAYRRRMKTRAAA